MRTGQHWGSAQILKTRLMQRPANLTGFNCAELLAGWAGIAGFHIRSTWALQPASVPGSFDSPSLGLSWSGHSLLLLPCNGGPQRCISG